MRPLITALFIPAAWLVTCGCFAQPAQQATAQAASAPKPAAATPVAQANRHVLEDDNVRIEESRTRGEVQSITVQSKVPGVKAYNIVPLAARKDPSQEAGVAGLAGKRTWSLLDF